MIPITYLSEQYTAAEKQCSNDTERLHLQKTFLLPLIEEEKKLFIKKEYPRLRDSMGNEYHIKNVRYVFHPLPESDNPDVPVLGDPYELSLQELALLPTLEKCIPRLGTLSYMPLFRIHPDEQKRLSLLAALYEQILNDTFAEYKSVLELLNGHEVFLALKSSGDDDVIIRY